MGEDPNVKVFVWYLTENQQMIQQLVVFGEFFSPYFCLLDMEPVLKNGVHQVIPFYDIL